MNKNKNIKNLKSDKKYIKIIGKNIEKLKSDIEKI